MKGQKNAIEYLNSSLKLWKPTIINSISCHLKLFLHNFTFIIERKQNWFNNIYIPSILFDVIIRVWCTCIWHRKVPVHQVLFTALCFCLFWCKINFAFYCYHQNVFSNICFEGIIWTGTPLDWDTVIEARYSISSEAQYLDQAQHLDQDTVSWSRGVPNRTLEVGKAFCLHLFEVVCNPEENQSGNLLAPLSQRLPGSL